jgi:hypothetical protein
MVGRRSRAMIPAAFYQFGRRQFRRTLSTCCAPRTNHGTSVDRPQRMFFLRLQAGVPTDSIEVQRETEYKPQLRLNTVIGQYCQCGDGAASLANRNYRFLRDIESLVLRVERAVAPPVRLRSSTALRSSTRLPIIPWSTRVSLLRESNDSRTRRDNCLRVARLC